MKEKKRVRNTDPYLSVQEAAEWCNISVDMIYDRVRRGEIVSRQLGRIYRIRMSDLETWINTEAARNAG